MPRTHSSGKFKPILQCIAEKREAGKTFNKIEREVADTIEASPSQCEYFYDHLTFTIYYLPKSLNERDKGHWTVKAKDRAIWDGLIMKAMYHITYDKYTDGMTTPFPLKTPVSLEFTPYRKRLLDVDNSATGIKHPLDSMVHCGVIENDDRRYVIRYTPNPDVKVKKTEEQRVEITLRYKNPIKSFD